MPESQESGKGCSKGASHRDGSCPCGTGLAPSRPCTYGIPSALTAYPLLELSHFVHGRQMQSFVVDFTVLRVKEPELLRR